MLPIIGRYYDNTEYVRSDTVPGPQMSLDFVSGAQGTAKVQVFTSSDHTNRGGVVIRFEILDGDCAFIPLAKNIENGVELHFAGEAEAASLINALKGVLAALPNPERYKVNIF